MVVKQTIGYIRILKEDLRVKNETVHIMQDIFLLPRLIKNTMSI